MNSLTTQSKKEEKRLYDKEYRRKNKGRIKREKQAYYQTDAGRVVSKRNRDKFKGSHLAYCQTEKYKALKKQRDEIFRAKKKYGEYWECMIIVKKIEKIICELVPDKTDRLKMRGLYQKGIIKRAFKRHLIFGWNFNY